MAVSPSNEANREFRRSKANPKAADVRKRSTWAFLTLAVAVVSSLIGFWLLDGVSLIASWFGAGFAVGAGERIASTVVCVSFALVVEQATMVSQLLEENRREVSETLVENVREQVATGVKELLVSADVLALARDLRGEQVRSILSDFGALLEPIGSLREPMRSGVIAWMQGAPLEMYRKSATDLTATGVSTSLSQHVAVSKAMFATCSRSYLQINHSAYDPTTEWTREWKDFLKTAAPGDRTFEYVVLATEEYIRANRTKLLAMQGHLREAGGELLVCNRRLVHDSIGPYNLDFNVEVFDGAILKKQSLNAGGYRGGITLVMALETSDHNLELMRIVRTIRDAAVPLRSGART